MDKDTRNAIERTTQRARKLLEEDFAAQLEGDFDVHRDGAVAPKAGGHLSARQAFQRERIVAAIEHKRAAGMSAADAARDYLRDAAFTTLNRFVALKMLEARDLVQECITKGEQSAGYREFCGMAPGLPLLPDSAGYRLYIESLFDELSTEVKVLFDRRDLSSVLWPKRATFEQLLEILNATELARVWGEDETIGWVYQFFNGQDERRKMREESQAPRNSRELAVRNQFFTPRYVVQFLTDNTLGRIWYEMRGTKTVLAERCEYMVRKPGELFAPRPKKDPRDLRVLDPACGSGHFLLYAFDLLLTIYEEAYADPESPKSDATSKALAEDYASIEALRKAVPGLVLAHNLHGVDIDPRCAQIAQLALWIRAQRAYRDLGIGRAERAQIRRSNIVVAEPLVADEQIAKEFVAKLGDAELGRVFTSLVESLSLAGDLGLLLRVDQLVAQQAKRGQTGDLFAAAEDRIRESLDRFVLEEASATSTRRRLFADDAAQGIGLLNLSRQRYEVVLMNPPFGLVTDKSKSAVKGLYPDDWTEIYACFVVRGLDLLTLGSGLLGAITSSLWFYTKHQEKLRRRLSSESRMELVADLGGGVLDGATVDTALLVACAAPCREDHAVAYKDLTEVETSDRVGQLCKSTWRPYSNKAFDHLPLAPLCFHVGSARLSLWNTRACLEPSVAAVVTGNSTFNNSRFLRLWWEVKHDGQGNWIRYEKGGVFQPFVLFTRLVWRFEKEARENRAFQIAKYGTDAQVCQSRSRWGQAGLCYSRATSVGFSPRLLNEGGVCNEKSIAIYVQDDQDRLALLGILASSHVQDLLFAFGRHRNIENRAVGGLPIDKGMVDRLRGSVAPLVRKAINIAVQLESTSETSPNFAGPCSHVEIESAIAMLAGVCDQLDALVAVDLGLLEEPLLSPTKATLVSEQLSKRFLSNGPEVEWGRKASYCIGAAFGLWPAACPKRLADRFTQLDPESPDVRYPHLGAVRWALVDDAGHPDDLWAATISIESLAPLLAQVQGEGAGLGRTDFMAWVSSKYFEFHLGGWSDQGRAAPVLWQLSIPSTAYSVWVNAQAFDKDTLFRVQNDYVAPKLAHEERRLESLTAELGEGATAAQRKQLAAQEILVQDLRAFLYEVKRVAPLWNPNLDDGVIINFAPLWRLVPQNKSWQKELRSTWDALCEAKYDWAHLAMHLWPERVVPKCAKDRSLAIAHGLEDVFWVEGTDGKWTARKEPTCSVDELVGERTSPAVKSALKSLLEAPAAAGKRGGRRGGGRRKGAAAAERGDA